MTPARRLGVTPAACRERFAYVTLEELSVDVLYPRDDDADRFFRALARR